MKPRIQTINPKKLVGKHLTMSLTENKTALLWKNFMPRRKKIINNLNDDLISMQIHTPDYFKNFDPTREFEKWAAVEVSRFDKVPEGMETFTLSNGLYAVFDYKGPANDPRVFQHIFQVWLPSSEYVLDERPHLEVLGGNYKNNDPRSEEEIWIPVKQK